jgi:hypothetical protein
MMMIIIIVVVTLDDRRRVELFHIRIYGKGIHR